MEFSQGEFPSHQLCLRSDGGTLTENTSYVGAILRVHFETPVKTASPAPTHEVPLQVGAGAFIVLFSYDSPELQKLSCHNAR